MRRQHGVELACDLGLERAVLEHRFHHQLDIGQRGIVGAGMDAGEDGVGLVLGAAALADVPLQTLAGIGLAFVGGGLVAVDEHGFDAQPGAVVGDARAHQARTNDADLAEARFRHALGAMHELVRLALVDEEGADHVA